MNTHYGPRLKMLHFCTNQAVTNALAEMDLTAAQGHILAYLAHHPEPPCPRDLEEVFHLSHPTVSGLLTRLEKKEFIAIRPDEQDKRCKRICLLPKGEACNQKMQQHIQVIEHQMVQGFSEEDQKQFAHLLDRAVANMGGPLRPYEKEDDRP